MRRSIIEKAIAEDAEIAEVRREKIKDGQNPSGRIPFDPAFYA
jgi:hypothetical protein